MQGIKEVVRDATFGQILRYVTKNRILQYPEELPGFIAPDYDTPSTAEKQDVPEDIATTFNITANNGNAIDPEKTEDLDTEQAPPSLPDIDKTHSGGSSQSDIERVATQTSSIERIRSRQYTQSRLQEERAIALHHTQSHTTTRSYAIAIAPTKTADGLLLVDWYTTDDPENPQNWSQVKKAWTAFLICLYTFVVYASSSIYVSSELLIMQRFGVGDFKASLGLALYVLGYGIGPLLFSPLSEGKSKPDSLRAWLTVDANGQCRSSDETYPMSPPLPST
jgi:DHA1 family multidrug resistance protein-like MFS transporter